MSPDKTPLGYAIKYDSWVFNVPILSDFILNGAIGVTINRTVHFSSAYKYLQEPRKTSLIAHEEMHCTQQSIEGWPKFLSKYLTQKGRTAYEVEAMRKELYYAKTNFKLTYEEETTYKDLLASSLANGYRLNISLIKAYGLLWTKES